MDLEEAKLRARVAIAKGKHSSCIGKTPYSSFGKANYAADQMEKRTGKPLVAYACGFCFKWHVGRRMPVEELEKYDPK